MGTLYCLYRNETNSSLLGDSYANMEVLYWFLLSKVILLFVWIYFIEFLLETFLNTRVNMVSL